MTTMETRIVTTTGEVRTTGNGRRLIGHAAVYNSPSRDLGGYTERIAPGAFDQVLATSPDVVCTINHRDDQVLARTTAGTLRLHSDRRGLRFEADIPDSPLGQNIRESIRRGDLTGASFRFRVGADRWDGQVRTITSVQELSDVTIATFPAYPAASVEVRSQPRDREVRDMNPTSTTTSPPEGDTRTAADLDEERAAAWHALPPAAGLSPDTAAIPPPGSETRTDVAGRFRDALLSVRPGEVRSLTNNIGISQPDLSRYFLDRLRASSVVLASGVNVITTKRGSVTFPSLSGDVAPGWTNEGAVIAPTDPTVSTVTAVPRKLAVRTELTNELWDDSDPAAADVLTNNMVAALGLALDRGLIAGSGTAPEIRGLINTPGIGVVSLGANGGAITIDSIMDGIRLLAEANAQAGAIIAAPRTWRTLSGLKDSTGRYLVNPTPTAAAPYSLLGIPVFISSQVSTTETQGTASNTSSLVLFDPTTVYVVQRHDIVVEADRSRLFDRDMSELRGKLRADLVVPNPGGVVRIQGILP